MSATFLRIKFDIFFYKLAFHFSLYSRQEANSWKQVFPFLQTISHPLWRPSFLWGCSRGTGQTRWPRGGGEPVAGTWPFSVSLSSRLRLALCKIVTEREEKWRLLNSFCIVQAWDKERERERKVMYWQLAFPLHLANALALSLGCISTGKKVFTVDVSRLDKKEKSLPELSKKCLLPFPIWKMHFFKSLPKR